MRDSIVEIHEAAAAVTRAKGCRCKNPQVESTVTVYALVAVRVVHTGPCVRAACAPTVEEVRAEIRRRRRAA